MSSHHVIRDGQEPPVFLLNEASVQHPLLGDLLEWSPLTICLDQAVPALIRKGFKADHILCQTSDPSQWHYVFDQHYSVSLVKVGNWEEVISAVKAILDTNAADFLHVLASNETSKKPFEIFDKVVFFSAEVKWTWYREGKYRKWMEAGSRVLLEGGYKEIIGEYLDQGDSIETTETGIIEMKGLEKIWIGEVFRL